MFIRQSYKSLLSVTARRRTTLGYTMPREPMDAQGEANARGLRDRLKGLEFAKVFTSPLQRARQTCALAGFGPVAEVERDLVEWDYGEYEGLRSVEIRAQRPGWELFRDGAYVLEGGRVTRLRDRAIDDTRPATALNGMPLGVRWSGRFE